MEVESILWETHIIAQYILIVESQHFNRINNTDIFTGKGKNLFRII